MSKVFKTEPFKNSIGQTINVGEEVLYVTTGYGHNVTTGIGVYAGFYDYGNSQYYSKRVVVMKYCPQTRYRHNETGIEVDYWWQDARVKAMTYPSYTEYYTQHKYGTPEYKDGVERYKAACAKYQEDRQAIYDNDYTAFKIPRWGRTTLQLNRIFKIAPTLSEEALNILTLPTK